MKSKSLIRQFLAEAEDLNLNKEPVTAAPPAGAPMSDADFPPAPPEAAPGMSAGAPNMPTPSGGGSNTVQKEVLNKDLIVSVTAQLKASVTTFEKIFEKGDVTVDSAKTYIDGFLNTLAFYAESISKVCSGGEMEAMPELPAEEPMPEAPTPEMAPPMAPEGMAPEGMPAEGGLEGMPPAPEGGLGGASDYTNPWGGYESSETEPMDFDRMGGM